MKLHEYRNLLYFRFKKFRKALNDEKYSYETVYTVVVCTQSYNSENFSNCTFFS